jgi:thiol:disulfide interchange protein DsbC
MNFKTFALAALAALAIIGTLAVNAQAQTPQETTIRKLLTERFGEALKIDEVSPAPMPGLYEVRVGTDLFYTDGDAAFLIVGGQIVDTKSRRNLT